MAGRSKNAHWKLKDIQPRHWKGVAHEAGPTDADELIHEVLALIPLVLTKVGAALPKNLPGASAGRFLPDSSSRQRYWPYARRSRI